MSFRCRISGDPYPTIVWKKGWTEQKPGPKTRICHDEVSDEHVLEIDQIKKKDAGTYTVVITNKFGSEQCPATLMVTEDAKEAEDWASSLKKM